MGLTRPAFCFPPLHSCFPLVDFAVREPADFFLHVTGANLIDTCTLFPYGFDNYRKKFISEVRCHSPVDNTLNIFEPVNFACWENSRCLLVTERQVFL
ncbi:hypothetical protein PRCB_17420 [Pantoea rodasii]|uniref:Uncharacterized protein n=1 Tax=Pantoea rodasii TaxID=1076549 RepID=A0A2M9W951_9GAMM|nr:hypothetical protein HA45_12560 [Pantoea rodasii]PJZ04061.1 hypothetical protein PRCB_17420 [Pantoea rodasii]